MGESADDVAKLHEGARETSPGPHIRACFRSRRISTPQPRPAAWWCRWSARSRECC